MRHWVISLLGLAALTGAAVAQTTNSGNGNGGGNTGIANGNGNGNVGTLSGNLSGNAMVQRFSYKGGTSVAAPGLAAAAVETCMGSASAGASGATFGISLGTTYVDRACNLRLYARTLYAMGHRTAATQLLCEDPIVARALATEGVRCLNQPPPGDYVAEAPATAAAYAAA
ncbi:MAG: hypothetical protein KGI57_11185, partial [Hyphomicrobiales bacterium]|nr:hypothetical protein [Hyphomicrobiales bacterium]